MNKHLLLKYLFSVIYILSTPFLAVSVQPADFGIYSIQLPAGWVFNAELMESDSYTFQNKAENVFIDIKKSSQDCADTQVFNKIIFGITQDALTRQEFIELRKPTFACQIMGQKSCSMLVLKSKETQKRRIILNPKANNKVYHFEIYGDNLATNVPETVLLFVSAVGLKDGSILASAGNVAGAGVSAGAAAQSGSAAQNTGNNNGLSSFTKVKDPTGSQQKTSGKNTSLSGVNMGDTLISVASGNNNSAGISANSSISGLSSAASSGGVSSVLSTPDGDEMEPIINPVGTVTAIPADADWALKLAKNPQPMLDALEGGRPGGEINALLALLRQTQGPFDENQEKALMKQYNTHATTDSPKAKKGIRSQSELLLQAMIHNQLMTQAAWEYDFAMAQKELAEKMGDVEDQQVNLMLAQIQNLLMQDQQSSLKAIEAESKTTDQIPTAEEIQAEAQEIRSTAQNVALSINSWPTAATANSANNTNTSTTAETDDTDAMVSRYFALREEHRMLVESNNGSSPEATELYREAMEIRKKLEAKGIDVFTYKKPEAKPLPADSDITGKEYLEFFPSKQDPSLSAEQNQAIAQHESNIAAAQRTLASIHREMAAEKNPDRREELRLQAIHMAQNIHDSKDLIESVRTGEIVKTRGPWDEHSAVVLAETSRKLRESFQRASQMQASYARMLNILKKYNPSEAAKFEQNMASNVIKGIFDEGGFAKAQQSIDALHAATKGASQAEQNKLLAQQDKAFERLEMVERHLKYAETIKSGCDKAIFVGTLFTGMGAGLALTMAYEGIPTAVNISPTEAIKNMAIQGGTFLAMAGVMKAGSWGIGKLLNPKVAQSEINTFKNILENNRYTQEMEWNKALVNQVKDKVKSFKDCKAGGGKNYLEVRKALDDAVAAANGSPLAKRIMKNELNMLESQIKSGATRDYSKLRECLDYQKVFDNRLQKSIYPRSDAEMISKLRNQGYNVEKSWFQEYRNACSRGINADRDAGLIAQYEKLVTKNGQPVSMGQFMDEAQKAYDASYKAVTGRSAKIADQSITTSAHNESFPLSWLQKKMEGPFTMTDPPVTPQDFQKAGKAIYNKVENALKGADPNFVKMQKACASLSKDLKSKVLDKLKNPPANSGLSPKAQQQALAHWQKVQKAMEDYATGNSDPFTTMKKLEQLTGSTNMAHNAREVQKLLNQLGGS